MKILFFFRYYYLKIILRCWFLFDIMLGIEGRVIFVVIIVVYEGRGDDSKMNLFI